MHVLIVTPYLPWPINSGGNAAMYSTLACLRGSHTFVLVCRVRDSTYLDSARLLEESLPHVRVRAVVVGPSKPAPTMKDHLRGIYDQCEKLGGQRLIKLRSYARQAYYRIARLFGRGLSQPSPSIRSTAPVNLFSPIPWQLVDAVQDELKKQPDLIQLEFVEMLSLVASLPDTVPKVFVHHQLHWVYSQRFMESNGHYPYGEYLSSFMELLELSLLQRFDGIITFSETDAKQIEERVPSARTYVSPFPIPADLTAEPSNNSTFKDSFVFLGSKGHFPNLQGLEWLLNEIWPLIRNRFDRARLRVIGDWDGDFVKTWSSSHVDFCGYVADLSASLQGTVMLVPLKIGSGIRTKILAAMSQRVPVVSTTVGYEGLLVKPDRDLLVRDTASDFADAAVCLAQDAELYAKLASSSYQTVTRFYSPEQVCVRRNQIYSELVPKAVE